MFTAPRVAATVALIVLGAGLATVSRPGPASDPSQDPGLLEPSPSPVAVGDRTAPTWVTGTIGLAPSCSGPELTIEPGVEHWWSYRCEPQTWTTSDERLTGTAVATWNADAYTVAPGSRYAIQSGRYEVDNDLGGWSCTYADTLAIGVGLTPTAVNDETVTCQGRGGQQGLTAILAIDWSGTPTTLQGLIIEGSAPPLP